MDGLLTTAGRPLGGLIYLCPETTEKEARADRCSFSSSPGSYPDMTAAPHMFAFIFFLPELPCRRWEANSPLGSKKVKSPRKLISMTCAECQNRRGQWISLLNRQPKLT